ncbi:MAG: hypothetical protein Fur0041_04160 [Bacteroidia bacterium]
MKTGHTSFLPAVAIFLSLFGIFYSGCQDSKAENKNGETGSIRSELRAYENKLNDVIKIHDSHVASYSNQMGATSESKALFLISEHRNKIEHHQSRIAYHKLQLVQADTSNAKRNAEQLNELKEDINQLNKDAESIRTGFDNAIPAHFSK